jgi:hypothetical protein
MRRMRMIEIHRLGATVYLHQALKHSDRRPIWPILVCLLTTYLIAEISTFVRMATGKR